MSSPDDDPTVGARPRSIDVEIVKDRLADDVSASPDGGSRSVLEGITAEIGALMNDVGTLVRTEARLAVQEVVDGAKAMQGGVITAAIGGVVALLGAMVLVAALVIGLGVLIGSDFWAAVIVGVVLAVGGYVLLNSGMAKVKQAQLKPTQAIRNVEKDVSAVKQAVTHNEGQR